MLRISKLADYACLIMRIFVEENLTISNATPNATNIAQSIKIGLPTVRKILQLLSRAGILNASRGTSGGYQLARPVSEISLLEIVEAVDGKLGLTDCCISNNCLIISQCQSKQGWKQINDIVAQALREKSLADFVGAIEK
jgi:FeS assembly SUF system regulator